MEFKNTGIKEIDEILEAVREADSFFYEDLWSDMEAGQTHIDNIQQKADHAAKKIKEIYDLLTVGKGGVL